MEIINGHVVTFDELNHIYYVDGIKVPSVSQICKMANPNMYRGVDNSILQNAAIKGSKLHKAIENYELTGTIDHSSELLNYIMLKKKFNIVKEHSEKIILIKLEDKVVCAGRFDLQGYFDGEKALIDFKRTRDIHTDYVKLQLNLYAYGLKQSYGEIVEKLIMIRLRDLEYNVIEFEVDESYTIDKLKKYINAI